ncbi:MAG TPA: hypothetical protein VF681_14175 [Abditibacteriaceae bacterium]|jgi:hypothetical protein
MRRLIQKTMGVTLVAVLGANGLATSAHAQEGLAGVGAAAGIAAGMGAISATAVRPGDVTRRMPSGAADGGMGAEVSNIPGGGAPGAPGTVTTTTTTTRVVSFSSMSGQTLLNELLAGGGSSRPTVSRPSRSPRAQAAYARRLARSTPAQRSRGVMSKYRIPPVGWRAYYLPQDRYKFGKVWQYVTIEDDSGAYPVRYYYRPWSVSMLRLLARSPRRGQLRAWRVVGFRTWQDAMLAGYRPDPISRPEPAGDIVYLAGLTRRDQLGRYVKLLYNGQITPATHAYNVSYVRRVASVVNSRRDTRRLMASTIGQILGAILGENSLPTSVGGTTRVVRATTQTTTMTAPANAMAPVGAR